MQAYPQELRDKVLLALKQRVHPDEIGEQLKVSRAWIYKVQKRYRDTGERGIPKIGGYRRSKLAQSESKIRKWLRSHDCKLTLILKLLDDEGISVKPGALRYHLNKWGLTWQKNAVRSHARVQQREDRQASKSRNKDRK